MAHRFKCFVFLLLSDLAHTQLNNGGFSFGLNGVGPGGSKKSVHPDQRQASVDLLGPKDGGRVPPIGLFPKLHNTKASQQGVAGTEADSGATAASSMSQFFQRHQTNGLPARQEKPSVFPPSAGPPSHGVGTHNGVQMQQDSEILDEGSGKFLSSYFSSIVARSFPTSMPLNFFDEFTNGRKPDTDLSCKEILRLLYKCREAAMHELSRIKVEYDGFVELSKKTQGHR